MDESKPAEDFYSIKSFRHNQDNVISTPLHNYDGCPKIGKKRFSLNKKGINKKSLFKNDKNKTNNCLEDHLLILNNKKEKDSCRNKYHTSKGKKIKNLLLTSKKGIATTRFFQRTNCIRVSVDGNKKCSVKDAVERFRIEAEIRKVFETEDANLAPVVQKYSKEIVVRVFQKMLQERALLEILEINEQKVKRKKETEIDDNKDDYSDIKFDEDEQYWLQQQEQHELQRQGEEPSLQLDKVFVECKECKTKNEKENYVYKERGELGNNLSSLTSQLDTCRIIEMENNGNVFCFYNKTKEEYEYEQPHKEDEVSLQLSEKI